MPFIVFGTYLLVNVTVCDSAETATANKAMVQSLAKENMMLTVQRMSSTAARRGLYMLQYTPAPDHDDVNSAIFSSEDTCN
jgi:hypothetical protein